VTEVEALKTAIEELPTAEEQLAAYKKLTDDN
jgi:hypothetical protein